MVRHIIIIGANAEGLEAASAARKRDRTAEITLITQEKKCGLFARRFVPKLCTKVR